MRVHVELLTVLLSKFVQYAAILLYLLRCFSCAFDMEMSLGRAGHWD